MPKRKKPIVRKRVLAKRKPSPAALLKDLTALIEEARSSAAREVNTVLVALYWRVGRSLRDEVIGEGRAEYGEQIVSAVGRQLVERAVIRLWPSPVKVFVDRLTPCPTPPSARYAAGTSLSTRRRALRPFRAGRA